ncbi:MULTISPECIES: hypothetical protein [unclassified Thioalkalivibrio]|uniref:hypothetical protein n=1 Tax=unclassified Thioalkalivibrio TaxID=2621013 RepID=UPI0003678834|nr:MULTISPECIES: hypothetical protein [unclassified Thioalkalivibrio]
MVNRLHLWASDFAWTEWLLVAGGRKGLFLMPGHDGGPERLEIHTLPLQGEGQLIHKGGWLTDPHRDVVLMELTVHGRTPETLAREVERGDVPTGPLRDLAIRLANAEGHVCERMLNEPQQRFRAQLQLPPKASAGGRSCDE